MKELQTKYRRYLIYLSARLAYDEIDREDLYQAGLIGLWEAQELYDESKGTFHSFAIMRMKGAMLKWLSKYSRTIHIPAYQLNKRTRTDEFLISTISTNTPINEDGGTIEDLLGIEDEDKSLDDAQDLIRRRLKQYFNELKQDYQKIILMREIEEKTLDEIGEEMGCTGENIRIKYNNAIKQLKIKMLNRS